MWPANVLFSFASAFLVLGLSAPPAAAEDEAFDDPEFSDEPRQRELEHPDWFKLSFLDLREDLTEAIEAGKQGLIVYFGQRHCAYCQALMEVNFGKPDIVAYTRENFDLVAIDIWGDREVTDMDGETLAEKEFSVREGTNFTPSLSFYNRDGEEVLLLRGYYPPYRFRAALEFVADRHYERMTFRDYLALADPPLILEDGGLSEEDFFDSPPYNLDRSRFPADRPLAVFFEQGDCHACDVLHTDPLTRPEIHDRLAAFEAVQLDMWADTPVVTPAGERTTARQWADRLGLFYAPSILLFDERGRERMRIDSVVRFFRLKGVLDYVLGKGYETVPNYQRWRERVQSRAGASGAVGSE